MSRTVVVTTVRTITLGSELYTSLTDEGLKEEFEQSIRDFALDEWSFDDESHTVEVFKTEDVILGE